MLMDLHGSAAAAAGGEMRADFVANASMNAPAAGGAVGVIDTCRDGKDDAKARERFLGIMPAQARGWRG